MTRDFYTKTTLHTATTLPPVTIICFEIWNLIMIVSAIHDDEWLKPFYWRWKLLLFNALWRHKLQRHHIRNRLIRVRKGCMFHWCIDCGKYPCLTCWGRNFWDDPRITQYMVVMNRRPWLCLTCWTTTSPVSDSTSHTTRTSAFEAGKHVLGLSKRSACAASANFLS